MTIEQRFFNPQHVDQNEELTNLTEISHAVGNREQGTHIVLRFGFDSQHRIAYAKFKVYGDPNVIAACDWLCEQVTGQKITTAETITLAQIANALEIPAQQHDKLIWLERAFLGVLNDYQRTHSTTA